LQTVAIQNKMHVISHYNIEYSHTLLHIVCQEQYSR